MSAEAMSIFPSLILKLILSLSLASFAKVVWALIKSCKSMFSDFCISKLSKGFLPVLKLSIIESIWFRLVLGAKLVKPSDWVNIFLICGLTANWANTKGSIPNFLAAAVNSGVISIVPGLLPLNKTSPANLVNL